MRHLYCLIRDRLLFWLFGACTCQRCEQERELEWQAEEMAEAAEAWANEGES